MLKRMWWLCAWLLLAINPLAQGQSLLVLGDSISAGYGIELEHGWVGLLQQRLEQRGLSYQVVNASISGETSAGGRNRLPALLQEHQPQLVVIELGGNDGLRGLPLASLQDNLAAMVQQSREQGAKVLLLGMRIPPNYGPRYSEGFFQTFQQVAGQYQVKLLEFFLQDVATVPGMMQEDGIHPTAQAQQQLLENVWPLLEPML